MPSKKELKAQAKANDIMARYWRACAEMAEADLAHIQRHNKELVKELHELGTEYDDRNEECGSLIDLHDNLVLEVKALEDQVMQLGRIPVTQIKN